MRYNSAYVNLAWSKVGSCIAKKKYANKKCQQCSYADGKSYPY